MAVFEFVRQWSELLASWVGDGWFWVVLGYLAPRLKKGARRLLASLQGAFWDLQKNTFQRLQSVSVADKKSSHCFIRFSHIYRYAGALVLY